MFGTISSSFSGRRRLPGTLRILLLCLCLTLAVIAANLMYSALTLPTDVLAGAAGELLYVSTFSALEDDWDIFAGEQSARIVAEHLEISVGAPQTAVWSTASPRFADFDISVRAIARDGPLDNAYGLVFHVNDQADGACALPAIVLCGISELVPLAGAALKQLLDFRPTASYSAFMISSDGYYSLWRTEDGRTEALSAWIPLSTINQGLGVENTIRIVAQGSRYKFFINDFHVPLCLPDDATAASTYAGGECIDGNMQDAYEDEKTRRGRIGVIAQATATGGGGVVVRFDDFIVYSPAQTDGEAARL